MQKNKKIAFLVPYPKGIAPGQRFRFEQYLGVLEESKVEYQILSFLDDKTHSILYKKGYLLEKVWGVLKGYLRRFWHLLKIISYDYVFVYRELSPFGFPIFEWIATKILRKKLIYDFDDAIWIPATSSQNSLISWLKSPNKVQKICSWSYKVSVGNEFLYKHAQSFAPKTTIVHNPTTIDTQNQHTLFKNQNEEPLVIGWTGSHSTLPYLETLFSLISELEKKYEFKFRVICDQNPKPDLKSFEFVKWNKKTEIVDLATFHIGLMPLSNDKWAAGKCGFKALQYMALGAVALASPVGVNSKIIYEGENGFLCENLEDWREKIEILLKNEELRKTIAQNAKQTIQNQYSLDSNKSNFLALFDIL
jgi:glycosyltransferase involved in cell wall biosynthesis